MMQKNIYKTAYKILGLLILTINLTFSQTETTLKVYFEYNKSNINSNEKANLIKFISNINNKDSISVYAFCDDIGSEKYNKNLAKNRNEYIIKLIKKYTNKKIEISRFDIGKVPILDKKNINFKRKQNRNVTIKLKSFTKKKKQLDLTINKKSENNKVVKIVNKWKNLFETKKKGDYLEDILFNQGQIVIIQKSKQYLNHLFYSLKYDKNIKIKLIGFVGARKISVTKHKLAKFYKNYFIKLSTLRAKYVYDYLIDRGIDAKQLSYEGQGYKPISNTKKVNPLDQRVRILIVSN